MTRQRISYVPLDKMDARMRVEMERCHREGTPRPASSAIRAHIPACFWFFAESLEQYFPQRRPRSRDQGIVPALCVALRQLRVLRKPGSLTATSSGALIEDQVLDLLNFDNSARYDERQKAALAYAEAIVWHLNTDDAFWERMHRHFSEPELVELGCVIGLTLGQQSWLRLVNIEHHPMAPGFEDANRLQTTKAQADYWANKTPSESAA